MLHNKLTSGAYCPIIATINSEWQFAIRFEWSEILQRLPLDDLAETSATLCCIHLCLQRFGVPKISSPFYRSNRRRSVTFLWAHAMQWHQMRDNGRVDGWRGICVSVVQMWEKVKIVTEAQKRQDGSFHRPRNFGVANFRLQKNSSSGRRSNFRCRYRQPVRRSPNVWPCHRQKKKQDLLLFLVLLLDYLHWWMMVIMQLPFQWILTSESTTTSASLHILRHVFANLASVPTRLITDINDCPDFAQYMILLSTWDCDLPIWFSYLLVFS